MFIDIITVKHDALDPFYTWAICDDEGEPVAHSAFTFEEASEAQIHACAFAADLKETLASKEGLTFGDQELGLSQHLERLIPEGFEFEGIIRRLDD
ncbi:MAG: hypothetical protein LCH53_05255 [Bacteroidetes bacterium]|nr:hypothetical protein [Bacteroidota bacterium]